MLPPEPNRDTPRDRRDAGGGDGARLRRTLGFSALGVSVLALGAGTALAVASHGESTGGSPDESQKDAAARNSRIDALNTSSAASFIGAGALAGTGLVLLLWPNAPKNVRASWAPGGGAAFWTSHF